MGGEKSCGAARDLVKDEQAVRGRAVGSAGLSPHLLLPSLNSTPHQSLDSSTCKSSLMLICFFSPPFPMIRSQKVVSAAAGECFHLRALTEPWLDQLYLHSRGSLCHLVKRTEGIRVLACNSLHNTETHAFRYKQYPPLHLRYFSPCISCFSDKKKRKGPNSLVCSICFVAIQQRKGTVKPA